MDAPTVAPVRSLMATRDVASSSGRAVAVSPSTNTRRRSLRRLDLPLERGDLLDDAAGIADRSHPQPCLSAPLNAEARFLLSAYPADLTAVLDVPPQVLGVLPSRRTRLGALAGLVILGPVLTAHAARIAVMVAATAIAVAISPEPTSGE